MILSAGFGTRLKPLTDNLPKALVEFNGKPMIEYQIERLKNLGCDEVVVNTHHFADKMEKFFKENEFGIKISLSYEPDILGTGGGILNAKKFLTDCDYFFVINVDVDTDFDLNEMKMEWEKIFNDEKKKENLLAMLLIQKRETKRFLEFDEKMILKGRAEEETPGNRKFAFNGVHIISPEIFKLNFPIEFSDILNLYLTSNKVIKGYNAGGSFFKDLGKKNGMD